MCVATASKGVTRAPRHRILEAKAMRILVVDDNHELCDLVGRSLARDGHQVLFATSAGEAKLALERERVELLVLDLGLPDGSGLELCREVRGVDAKLLILVLTAQTAVASRVMSLNAGADDHLGKPFAVAELRARVRALGRRVPLSERGPLRLGHYEFDRVARRVTLRGEPAPITSREWAILDLLIDRRGQVVARDDLLRLLWQRVDDATRASLEVLMSRIRKKLGANIVRTVRGEGYILGDE